MNEETRKKISLKLTGMRRSFETRQKMSLAQKGRKRSLETRQKISQTLHGKKHSLESRKNMSLSKIGMKYKPYSAETHQRLSLLRKGKKHSSTWKISDEGKLRISEAQKSRKRVVSEETRKKLSQIGKGRIVSKQRREKASRAIAQAYKDGKFANVNKNYKQGSFYSKKNNKDLHYRSSWELQAYKLFEQMSKIISYEVEPFFIEYQDDNNLKRNYVPDMLVVYDDGSKELIEIKPKSLLNEPRNILKFETGRRYAKENDMRFVILTEDDLKTKVI